MGSQGDGVGYVGWDPTLGSVVVAHQGTNPLEILSLLTDGDLILTHLDPTLFPGTPSSIQVHEGFANEHAKTAPTILADVLVLLNQYDTSSVVVTGHSLGAALALLDSVYLQLHLPEGTNITMVGYGMPLTHINHKKDPITIVPGKFLGYEHPDGEIHIQDDRAPRGRCVLATIILPLFAPPEMRLWWIPSIFGPFGPV
ncbi:Alpha/Beta hydrolase protein [Russula vinacea]|nr:Alpha/Beta hydrolase protein [Russula vinacea]